LTDLKDLSSDFWADMETIFSGFDGAIIIDVDGTILLFTEFYARQMGVRREDVLGRNVSDIFPTTRLLEVIQTGQPIIAEPWEWQGKGHVVSRVPITVNGKIIGAAGYNVIAYDKMPQFLARLSSLNTELSYYKETVKRLSGARYSLASIIGNSEPMLEAKEKARQVAGSSAPVLIYGETGTGKELFAHAIHQESPRRDGPMVRINCAGIPESLMESELFGYEEGAFTGARKGGKPGKFELANKGSIFLDEINDLPYAMQAKLLRVLQEKEFDRVGGTRTVSSDVRVISASNVDLRQPVADNRFRRDLFYRLNVFFIRLPPLRERPEDIPLLVDYFIERQNTENGTHIEGVDREAMNTIINFPWPGNVRELEICIERACLDAQAGVLGLQNLVRFGGRRAAEQGDYPRTVSGLKEARERAEKEAIELALRSTGGNKQKAADLLGIHRTSLYYKLREYDMI